MPPAYVSLDFETTGLDPDRDAIIEVGAVRFGLDGHCETFSTLVDPKRVIPYRVERLTGISNEEVAGAPLFADVAGDLEVFIGEAPVVGQNIAFDIAFLKQGQIEPRGPQYDTQELASFLLPDLVEHNLYAIARHLDIEFPVRHRALADAEAARSVFLALRRRIAALPPALLAEAARVAATTDWPLRLLLDELATEHPVRPDSEDGGLIHGAVRPPGKSAPPLRATGERDEIDSQELERLLTTAARDVIPSFEDRPEQIAMANAVADALNTGEELLVEAGTGTGKSLAYLLPAARHAMNTGERVVVSTNTINLQEQLIGQDIPAVQAILKRGRNDSEPLRAAQLKGRRNYLCLLRWSNLRRSPSLTPDEAKLLVRLLLWLPHTESGDRAELRLSQGEDAVWGRISAQNESCIATSCPFVKDGSCFMLRARKRAEAAHLLVVNHALVLSDVAVGGGVIPDYGRLILDEAQHIEAEATRQLGFHAGEDDIATLLDGIAAPEGGLANSLRNAARGPAAEEPAVRELLRLAAPAERAVERARVMLPEFFLRLAGFLRQQSRDEGTQNERLLLTRAIRVQPDWGEVELAWENLSASLADVFSAVDQLQFALQAPGTERLLDHERLLSDADDALQGGRQLRQGIADIILKDDADTICWLAQHRTAPGVGIASAPLRVADVLSERLISHKETVVLTGATLTADGQFDYLRETIGLPEAQELHLGSPFDYARSTLLLLPRDMPQPNDRAYMPALQQTLIELVRASQGRALVLFTAHGALRAAHAGIKQALEEEQILVLGHNVDGSPRQLIQALRDNPRTVVLGTASFWEGVDVVGEALSLLVIARLPFAVPDDPVFKARSELFDDPFSQYAVPQAVLRFKQGFGRLIRRKTDRGVAVVLDGRIETKSYGESFLHSLPPCTKRRTPLREMAAQVTQWLGTERR